jgi:hypothetical protein
MPVASHNFFRRCWRPGRSWAAGVEQLCLFITWLRHAGPDVSGLDVPAGGQVLVGQGVGRRTVRGV